MYMNVIEVLLEAIDLNGQDIAQLHVFLWLKMSLGMNEQQFVRML